MTWEDLARTAMLAGAAVFAVLADCRSRRAMRHSRETERYCRQACEDLRRVQQIRARRVQGATPPSPDGSGITPNPTSTAAASHGTANR